MCPLCLLHTSAAPEQPPLLQIVSHALRFSPLHRPRLWSPATCALCGCGGQWLSHSAQLCSPPVLHSLLSLCHVALPPHFIVWLQGSTAPLMRSCSECHVTLTTRLSAHSRGVLPLSSSTATQQVIAQHWEAGLLHSGCNCLQFSSSCAAH